MSADRITYTANSYKTRIVGVVESDVPTDGGKWALICEHYADGEWLGCGVVQDTNKRRLADWIGAKREGGFTEWCPECQLEHAKYVARRIRIAERLGVTIASLS